EGDIIVQDTDLHLEIVQPRERVEFPDIDEVESRVGAPRARVGGVGDEVAGIRELLPRDRDSSLADVDARHLVSAPTQAMRHVPTPASDVEGVRPRPRGAESQEAEDEVQLDVAIADKVVMLDLLGAAGEKRLVRPLA